jgi:uncharacterized membrane protein HdeD (DUF308 family)
MNSHLHRNWPILGLRALAASLFVILTIGITRSSFARVIALLASYFVVDGVLSLLAAIRQTPPAQRSECLVFAGFISVIAGALLLIWPTLPPATATMAVSVWGVATGLLTIAAALNMKMPRGRFLLGITGAVSVLLSVPLGFAAASDPIVAEWIRAYAILQAFLFVSLVDRLRP